MRTFFQGAGSLFLTIAIFLWVSGCATGPPLPAANLQEPGWRILQGQAVWKSSKEAAEISGELLFASSGDGRTFLQFTKTPFPLVIAQRTPSQWQLQSAMKKKIYRAPGAPPARIIWFELMQRLQSRNAFTNGNWRWEPRTNDWKLSHTRTGET